MINSSSFNKKVIRFRRRGHCQYPVFEIVLTSKNKRSRGSFIEKLGFYNPNFTERLFFVDVPRMVYWLNRGVLINKNVQKYLLKFLQYAW